MKKIFIFVSLIIFLLTFSLLTSTVSAQTSCNLTALTPIIQLGQPASIRLTGAFGGTARTNATYNFQVLPSGEWVDVGDLVGDTGGDFTIMNNNYGNQMFTEGTNTIIFRRAQILSGQTNLCSTTISVTSEPVIPGNDICQACGDSNPCKQGLSCVNTHDSLGYICLPGSGTDQGVLGSGCLNDDQCSKVGNFECSANVNSATFCASPTTTAPGQCVERPPQETLFNCADRGGQCGDVPFLEENCRDNVPESSCDLFDQCWINPNNATGEGYDASTRGSCVVGDMPGCGEFGSQCCRNSSGQYVCNQGTPDISDGPLEFCFCEGGNRPLGAVCDESAECNSGNCSNRICSLNGQCIEVPPGTTENTCLQSDGFLCKRKANSVGIGQADFCCPTAEQCIALGGESTLTNYMCINDGSLGIKTVIGCVPIKDPNAPTAFFLRWTTGVVGGIAMILLIIGSFQIITSKGDKYKLQSGKDIIFATVAGVFLIIFAVTLYRTVAQVLGIF